MVYVFPLLLALIVSALGELGYRTGWVVPWAWLPLLALPYGLAALARAWVGTSRTRAVRPLELLAGWLPWLGQAVAVLVLGWGEWLAGRGVEPGLLDLPGPGVLLLLVPYLGLELATVDARSRSMDTARRRRALRSFQLRQLAASFGQLGLVLLFTWPLREFRTVRVVLEEVAAAEMVWLLGLLLAFALILPGFLRFTWNTVPMPPGQARSELDRLASRAEFRYRELLLWRTGDLVANAAIVGFGPRGRVILFSDALMARLAPRELLAVFGHEMGHSLRRHILAFLSWTVGVVLLADWLGTELDRRLADPTVPLTLVTVAVPVLWYVGFGWASRRFELDADLVSVELTGDAGALAGALEKVSGGAGRDRDSWRHFSTAKRVRFLSSLAREPALARRLRRDLGRFVAVSCALLAFGLVMKVHEIAQVFPEDRVLAELRLGSYEAAERHALEAGLDPELVELARLGVELSEGGSPDPATWLALAARARERDQGARAERLEELAGLRGVPLPAAE